jgi:hypothetical protein
LENIRTTNGPTSLPTDDKNIVSVYISVGKYSTNADSSNLWCHYCEENNHSTHDCRAISKFKNQKKALFEAIVGYVKSSLAFLFEDINSLKGQWKPEKAESNKKSIKESRIPFLQ